MNTKIKCFVIASILLNLLLIGIIIGHVSHRFGAPRPLFKEPPEIAQLSPDKQKIFREAMNDAREKSDDLRKQSRRLKKESLRILSAREFDQNAYDAKVKEMIALHEQRKLYFAEAVAGIAGQFTPEERKVLAKMLSRPMPGEGPPPPPPHGGPRGDGPPPPPPGDGPPPPEAE